jgi:hypothetical protein
MTSCARFAKLREENFSKHLSSNLIENSSFEIYQDPLDADYPGWIIDKLSVNKVAIDSTRSFTGKNCLKISQATSEMQLVTKPFSTHYRNVYGIKFSAKSVLRKIPIAIHFLTFSENGKIVSKYYRNVTIDTNWQTYSLTSDYLKVNSEFGRVFITIPENNSVLLIDDVTCHIIDSYQKK